MINSIEEYLLKLKEELSECDPDIVKDALTDSEEHLREALNNAYKFRHDCSKADLLQDIIKNYGTPYDIAATYKEIEALQSANMRKKKTPTNLVVFLSVLITSAHFLCLGIIGFQLWGEYAGNRIGEKYFVSQMLTNSILALAFGVFAYYLWRYYRKSEKDLPLVLGLIPVVPFLSQSIGLIYLWVTVPEIDLSENLEFILTPVLTLIILIMLIVIWRYKSGKKREMLTLKRGVNRY